MEIRLVSGALGAEVRGLDLAALDEGMARTIRDLVHEHLVVFFLDQDLSIDAHQRLGESLGEIVANAYIPSVDTEHPGVSLHRSEDGYVANVWHSDGQPRPAPVKFTIFKMVTCPTRGGDTMWANQYLVYERLSPPMRELLDGLTALQRSGVNLAEQSPHPAVLVHPETGRKLLYVSKFHTVRFLEMSVGESRALIDYLVAVAAEPEYTCRYRWSPGVVGIWDNLATQHYGVNDFDEPRVFHRVMIQGPTLPANAGRWPALDDDAPRTMVTKDGSAGVVGEFNSNLWSRAD